MIHRQYLLAMTAAWVRELPNATLFLRQVEAGRPVSARELALHAAEHTQDPVHSALWLQASADMALLAGNLDEAHSAYGRSLRQAHGSFATFLAERADARKALSGAPVTPAAQAFWRSPATGGPWDDGMERLAGCALLCHDGAFPQAAQRHANDLAARALARHDADWHCIADVLLQDLNLSDRIHRLQELSDHVYWVCNDAWGISTLEAVPVMPMECEQGWAFNLMSVRCVQLRRLFDTMAGARTACTSSEDSATYSQFAASVQQAEYLESAMVSLAVKRLPQAEELLQRFERQDNAHIASNDSLQCELLYCLSRLRMLQGRQEEGADLYRRYASSAVRRVRQRQVTIRRLGELPGISQPAVSDDIGARLPARYRRAYDWMVSHIGDAGLSVKDVAATAGVTERALQQTFKRHIGDSPTEVMRQLRMQQIHHALKHEGNGRELIMDIAQRFGVNNRTTLATSYRKYYAQSPSQSLGL